MDTCGICLLTYNGQARKPLVLPCSHSFCQDCLQQLNSVSNKDCPCCRKSWQDTAVADLVFCRQLIPVQVSDKAKLAKLDVCQEHGLGMSLWCDSCHIQLCIKCRSDYHCECQCFLIEVKRNLLVNKLSDSQQTMKNMMQSTEKNVRECADVLTAVTFLEKELSIFKGNLNNCIQEYHTWNANVKKEVLLSSTSGSARLDECSITSLEQRLDKIQVPEIPETLLGHVATAYFATCEKNTADSSIPRFVENLNKRLISANPTTTNIDCEGAGDNSQPKTLELKEGQEWTLVDCTSAAAAIKTLTNTSIRPRSVTVKDLINWQKQNVEELFKALTKVQCDVELYILNCFTEVSNSSRAKTKEIANVLFENTRRCRLVGAWGQFDKYDLKQLPNTVKTIGLVLSSKEDMEAVNILPNCLMWDSFTGLHISIMPSFDAANWSITWICNPNMAGCLKFDLHFPCISEGQVEWMVDIISKITYNFTNNM